MNIGIFFTARKKSGGVYQYSLNIINALKSIQRHNYFIFNFSSDFLYKKIKLNNWKVIDFSSRKVKKYSSKARKKMSWKRLVFEVASKLGLHRLRIYLIEKHSKRKLKNFYKYNLDLIIYPSISEFCYLLDIPSIVAIHDVGHRLIPQFPEISKRGQYVIREHLYKKCIKAASYVLAGSEWGKKEIIKFYKVPKNKVIVLPAIAFEGLVKNISLLEAKRILKKYNLPARFIFYPAQFWLHKNHQNLIRALSVLKKQNIIIPLVLIGSKRETWDEFNKVTNLIKEKNLEKQVYYLGYVDNKEISALYKLALSMVMPTFLPTATFPVTEAWQMNCPVLYSNIRGCKDQAGDAALLLNPSNPKDIADKIRMIWENKNLRSKLIRKGKKRLNEWTTKDFNKKVAQIVNNFEKNHITYKGI